MTLMLAFVKRLYTIQNIDTVFIKSWQGHKVEQRWFSVVQGSFKIILIAIDDWVRPSLNLEQYHFILTPRIWMYYCLRVMCRAFKL
jgi:hypothetical protein